MGIKDWLGLGDKAKKKQAYREAVKEAVADGRLSNSEMMDLSNLRKELDVTDAADDRTVIRREIFNEAVEAVRRLQQDARTTTGQVLHLAGGRMLAG